MKKMKKTDTVKFAAKMPKSILVSLEKMDDEHWMNAQKAIEDFNYDDEPVKMLAVYELKRVVVAERKTTLMVL